MEKEYYMLELKKDQLSEKMKSLIVRAIAENNGCITANKEKEDNDYPLTPILCGEKDIYFIFITEIYLNKKGEICVDGIDSICTGYETGFLIKPEQYSYILQFIAYKSGWKENPQEVNVAKDTINSTIMEMACQLAEKEMVNGYGKLTEYFMNKEGEYTDFYQDVFNPLYDKYYKRIADLADFELI